MSLDEPCAVCGQPILHHLDKRFKIEVEDGKPRTATVFVHTRCSARARDEFQPTRPDAPKSAPRPTRCSYCENDISDESCWCGDDLEHDAWNHGHTPVPMGCVCLMEAP